MLPTREDWLPIAEQASKEMDPEKLMILVEQLCSALDGHRKPGLPSNGREKLGGVDP